MLRIFSELTSRLSHQTVMETTTADPNKDLDARPFKFLMHPHFTRDAFLIKGNALILSNGVCTADVSSITNLKTGRWVEYPYTEEMRESVKDACAAHFEDEAFARFLVTETKVYFY